MDEIKTKTWEQYERCKNYLSGRGYFAKVDKYYRFYEGRQWGEASGDEELITTNFIEPIVNYKVSTVAQNGFSIVLSNTNYRDNEFAKFADVVTKSLNDDFAKVWEYTSMDSLVWDALCEAAQVGAVGIYTYFENGKFNVEIKDASSVLLADEQETDIQEQPYILLPYRQAVYKVREEAKRNGIKETGLIVADTETLEQAGDGAKIEVENDDEIGKCLVILKLWKEKGKVYMCKSTRSVEILKKTDTGLSLYPISFMTWKDVKGSARGRGEVEGLINNQIEVNKTFSRRAIAIKMTAFPKTVYDKALVKDVDELLSIGGLIGVEGLHGQSVGDFVKYLEPATQSADAKLFADELMQKTKDNAGAGDVALGNINPEQASGKAILAVKDASSIPLNRQMSKVKKFIEDLARVWWDIHRVYRFNKPITYTLTENGQSMTVSEVIPQEFYEKALIDLKVDVSPQSSYSKYATEMTLENFLIRGMITIDEYVKALPNGSVAPKDKLQKILDDRKENEKRLQAAYMQGQADKQTELEQIGLQEMETVTNLLNKTQSAN